MIGCECKMVRLMKTYNIQYSSHQYAVDFSFVWHENVSASDSKTHFPFEYNFQRRARTFSSDCQTFSVIYQFDRAVRLHNHTLMRKNETDKKMLSSSHRVNITDWRHRRKLTPPRVNLNIIFSFSHHMMRFGWWISIIVLVNLIGNFYISIFIKWKNKTNYHVSFASDDGHAL